jgi:hypothetical protein
LFSQGPFWGSFTAYFLAALRVFLRARFFFGAAFFAVLRFTLLFTVFFAFVAFAFLATRRRLRGLTAALTIFFFDAFALAMTSFPSIVNNE